MQSCSSVDTEPMLLGVGKEKKPQRVMLADVHGVNVPMANLKLEATNVVLGRNVQ